MHDTEQSTDFVTALVKFLQYPLKFYLKTLSKYSKVSMVLSKEEDSTK